MKFPQHFLMAPLFAGMGLLSLGAQAAELSISFKDPDHFRDIPWSNSDRERMFKEVTRHFTHLAAQLPSDETLTIDVTDVSLAGVARNSAMHGREIRILRNGADFPSMSLHYRLNRGDTVLAEGNTDMDDKDYAGHLNKYPRDEYLRYEKAMMDQWFAGTFKAQIEHLAAR